MGDAQLYSERAGIWPNRMSAACQGSSKRSESSNFKNRPAVYVFVYLCASVFASECTQTRGNLESLLYDNGQDTRNCEMII